jgi:transcriptional regulator with XRE-family HTH domain
MELGERVKKMRQAAGLSQRDVAERAGIDRTMVGKIELHNQNPSLAILRRIATGLGCSVVDLLDEEDKRPRKTAT